MKITSTNHLRNLKAQYSEALDSLEMRVLVCGGTGCVAGGSVQIYEKIRDLAKAAGVNVCVSIDMHECGGGVGIHLRRHPVVWIGRGSKGSLGICVDLSNL